MTKINLLTAKPTLELLLAENGFEAPYSDPESVWDLFLEYAAVPSDAAQDSICFQTSFVEAEGEEVEAGAVFVFARQLTSADGETRSVQIQYTLGDAYSGTLAEVDVWSDDFPDVASFAEHVAASPHFRLLCADSSPAGDLFVEIVD